MGSYISMHASTVDNILCASRVESGCKKARLIAAPAQSQRLAGSLLSALTLWVCGQAIDLIDEAGSRVRLRHAQLPEEARELDKELRALLKEKDAAVRGQARPRTPRLGLRLLRAAEGERHGRASAVTPCAANG